MSNRTLDETYSLLLDMLRQQGLEWVAAQVQDQVRAGKPAKRRVALRPASEQDLFVSDSARIRSPKREVLAATEPYSARERVACALDAIEHVATHAAEMEAELTAFARGSRLSSKEVVFVPDEFEDAPRTGFGALTRERADAVANLRRLLSQLREEVGSHGDHR